MSQIELESLRNDLANYTAQRDQAQVNYQQLVGAIFVVNEMIKKLELQPDVKPILEGDISDGETNSQVT